MLAVKFNSCDGLNFVQGDMRVFSGVVYDPKTAQPADLTGSIISLNLPRDSGGSIKRTNAFIAVAQAQVIVPPTAETYGYIAQPDHGLVTGDTLQYQTSGTLPAPLAPTTNYKVQVIDNDNFYVTDTSGVIISLTDQGTVGGFTYKNLVDLVLGTTPVLGQFTFNMRAPVSGATNAALAQDFQVNYTNAAGSIQIILIQKVLDVYPQPVP